MKNCRQLISAVADGLLLYKLNLRKWVRNLNVSHALRWFFTPALKILLK
jgi:hypothetical protein